MLIGLDASRITRSLRTGTENYSLQVIRHLLAQDSENAYRLYLSAALPPGMLPVGPRSSTRIIRLPRLWTHVGLSAEMVRAAPDVLFVPSHVLPVVTPRRSVVVVYDVAHRFVPRAHTLVERLYSEWSIRRHVRIATRLLTISESSKRDLVRLYGADPGRVDIAYPAADSHFEPTSATAIDQVRRAHQLGPRYVLHLGTIKPRKNLPRLVHAFARAKLAPDTQLALGGLTTRGGAAVERAIVEAGISDRVRRLAYVSDAELPALYSGAACVAIVSLYEGFGMPALEALACGASVVASDRGSLPEIVSGAGTLVDPLDVESIARGLEQAVADGVAREQGPRRARQFSWSEAARVTLSALEQAAGKPPRALAPSAPS